MFMNWVHEQCPKIDSRTVLSQTRPKTGRVHRVHSLGQPVRPGRARPAPLACLPCACALPAARPCRVPVMPCVLPARLRAYRAPAHEPSACLRSPYAPASCPRACCAPRAPCTPSPAPSHTNSLCHDTNFVS